MPQSIPLSQVAFEATEGLIALFNGLTADGVISAEELPSLRQALDAVHLATMRSDLARSMGMALIKGGNCKRVRELMADWPADVD